MRHGNQRKIASVKQYSGYATNPNLVRLDFDLWEDRPSAVNELKFEPGHHSRRVIVGWTTLRDDRENFLSCNFAHAGLDF